MSPTLILACIAGYFAFLLLIAWFTSRNASNASYFLGNKASPWYAVAFGLIGDSLSGVTFISVPGQVDLVNTRGLTLNWWDGGAGLRNNGLIEGGDGIWVSATPGGSDRWTQADGTINAPYQDSAFAIFTG